METTENALDEKDLNLYQNTFKTPKLTQGKEVKIFEKNFQIGIILNIL